MNQEGCAICLEDFDFDNHEPMLLAECQHSFCNTCILDPKHKLKTCPLCLKPILSEPSGNFYLKQEIVRHFISELLFKLHEFEKEIMQVLGEKKFSDLNAIRYDSENLISDWEALISTLKKELERSLSELKSITESDCILYENFLNKMRFFIKGFTLKIDRIIANLDYYLEGGLKKLYDEITKEKKKLFDLKEEENSRNLVSTFFKKLLYISTNKSGISEDTIPDKLKSVESVIITLEKETLMSTADLLTLNNIIREVTEARAIHLNISLKVFTKELFHILKENVTRFSQVDVTLKYYYDQLGSQDLETKFITILREKDISLNLIHSLDLKNGLMLSNLIDLHLDLARYEISDQKISHMLAPMPRLKKIYVNWNETRISDESVNLLVKNTLNSAEDLEHVSIILSNTQITDKSMAQFFIKSKKVKFLCLDIRNTKVSSRTVDFLFSITLGSLKDLKELDFRLDDKTIFYVHILKLIDFRKDITYLDLYLGPAKRNAKTIANLRTAVANSREIEIRISKIATKLKKLEEPQKKIKRL